MKLVTNLILFSLIFVLKTYIFQEFKINQNIFYISNNSI